MRGRERRSGRGVHIHTSSLPVAVAVAVAMPTTFVVAAAWRGTGIGNSIYHAALWLTLTRQLDARVKFSQCLPAGTYHLNTSLETRRLRRGELPLELRAMPNCSAPGTFELWERGC